MPNGAAKQRSASLRNLADMVEATRTQGSPSVAANLRAEADMLDSGVPPWMLRPRQEMAAAQSTPPATTFGQGT